LQGPPAADVHTSVVTAAPFSKTRVAPTTEAPPGAAALAATSCQAPPGVKIGPRAFGRDRRYPITNGYTNLIH
jgi:hypothetical protein